MCFNLLSQNFDFTLVMDSEIIKQLQPMIPIKTKFTKSSLSSKLQPLQNEEDPMIQISNSIKMLADRINDLCSAQARINDINTSDPYGNKNRLEDRFQRVFQAIPKLPEHSYQNQEQRRHATQLWLGNLCREVFSITFSMFQIQKLNDRKAKAFCCENMLSNIIAMIRKNDLTVAEIANIDRCLREELIPYFLIKYPMSEEAEVNLQFSNKIIEIDSLDDNQNDLVFKSKVQFNYRPDGNYNRQIMRFLNYIIDLPNLRTGQHSETLFKLFYNDMEEFFKNVEDQQFTILMNKYDIRSQKIVQSTMMADLSKVISQELILNLQHEKQKQKYRESVRSYTKKLIGRKISQNVKPFTELDIEEGELKLKNPAIMRIITKWCIQLMTNFEVFTRIINKESQFRMKDGGEKILKRKHLLLLAELIKREKKNVEQYLKKTNDNNSSCQFDFSKAQIPKNLLKFSQDECQVGLFSASVISNYQIYLVGYINTIIHALMTAIKDYQEMVKAYEYKQEQFGVFIEQWRRNNISFQDLVNRAYSYRLSSVPASYISLVPQMISFRIGDILRCRCTSKEKEVIALYTELERISRMPKSDLKIVRIKNRLERGTKDILINILYRKSMLVQMQLAVATNRSKFIDFSNKYNHVLYELSRAEFGPISQMCNIWINNDVKADFYLEQTKFHNTRKNQSNSLKFDHLCNGTPITFPFRCSECKYFYNDCNYVLKHVQCSNEKCRKTVCSLCRAEKFDYETIKKFFTEIPEIDLLDMKPDQSFIEYRKRICVDSSSRSFLEDHDSYGMLIDLKGEDKKPIFYVNFKVGRRNIITEIIDIDKSELRVLKQVSTSDQIRTFKKEYLIFSSNKITQRLKSIDNKIFTRFMTSYIFPRYMKKWYIKEKYAVTFMSGSLQDEDLAEVAFRYPSTSKICFYQNNIKNISSVLKVFQECEILDIGSNCITELACKEGHLYKLQVLYVNYNKINKIDPNIFAELTNLKELQLANNQITELPTGIGQLKKLKILNLSRNYIKSLPDQITELSELQILNIYSSPKMNEKLSQLPRQIGKLKNLKKINFNFNNISVLPDSIGDLSNLQIVYAVQNKIKKLPQSFTKLQDLKILNLANNQFQVLPEQVGSLLHLEILNLENSSKSDLQTKKLPNCYCNLTHMKMIDISQNKITQLPQNIGQMNKLETLFIYENKIKTIPKSIGHLRNLRQLYASNNLLEKLPDQICELTNLQKLTMKQNPSITALPLKIGALRKLKFLVSSGNSISEVPDSLCELSELKQLILNNNKITKLPQLMTKLRHLTRFQIDYQKLDSYSKRIASSITGQPKN